MYTLRLRTVDVPGPRHFAETDENWDEGILERLATIQAVFQRVRNRKTVSSRTYHTHALPAENPLDEKSKKAGHHGAW